MRARMEIGKAGILPHDNVRGCAWHQVMQTGLHAEAGQHRHVRRHSHVKLLKHQIQ